MKHIIIIAMLGLAACTTVAESNPSEVKQNSQNGVPETHQYTFTWNYADDSALKPRGGSSIGVPVTLDKAPSPEWQRLQEEGLTRLERDRRAILAMVGDYKVSFDFVEVAGFTPNYQQTAPYRSWATEKVYVLEDKPEFISLQHILVMQTMNKDGTKNKPMLTKHWRQDWTYQPKQVLRFKGNKTWQAEAVPTDVQKGQWSQTVYQVDDSPRYGGVAAWQHFGNYSSWNSPDTWRPLPRREYSVRDDYQLLLGNNDVIILPTGWVHEQQNNKVVLDGNQPDAKTPVIAREMGFNRYERMTGYDFSLSDDYFTKTAPFWAAVRQQWTQLAATGQPLHLREGKLYQPLFEYAHSINTGKNTNVSDMVNYAKKAVKNYLVESESLNVKAGY